MDGWYIHCSLAGPLLNCPSVGKDTTYCKELMYGTTAQGYLDELEYLGTDDKSVKLKGRKNVPDVLTFYMDSIIFDKVPLVPLLPENA
jgi:hypothetical protein